MKSSFLKSFDKYLCPIATRLASLVPKPGNSQATLVIRPGGMGDLICAQIALESLLIDSKKVVWLIEKRSKSWANYRRLPHVCYDEYPFSSLLQLFNSFDRVVNTEQFFGLSQTYALWACTRTGRLYSFDSNRCARQAHETIVYDWDSSHETVEFARLLARAFGLGAQNTSPQYRERLFPVSNPPLVLIAGRQSPSRSLSLDAWEHLIAQWSHERSFVLASSPEDLPFARLLLARFDKQAMLFSGTFDGLCDQIACSEEVLTMDGGGVHIASFFGVPTLAIFSSGRDRKWMPLGCGSRILRRHDLACQPCTRFGQVPECPNRFACLQIPDIDASSPVTKPSVL